MSYVLLDEAGAVSVYPYSLHDLRRENPNTSFPATMSEEVLAEWRVYRVLPNSAPTVPHTKNVAEADPTLIDSVWTQTWIVTDATPEQVTERTNEQAAFVRADRNARLAACDWTQLADAPVSSLDWANYRQALRDITAQAGFPWSVEWPTQPS
jgi:hypothetical protein